LSVSNPKKPKEVKNEHMQLIVHVFFSFSSKLAKEEDNECNKHIIQETGNKHTVK